MPADKGIIQTVSGNGSEDWGGDGGPAIDAARQTPYACEFDPQGNMIVRIGRHHRIRRMDARTGIITLIPGTGEPKAIRCDLDDNMTIVDLDNCAVRRIDARTGIVTTISGGREGSDGDGGPDELPDWRIPMAAASMRQLTSLSPTLTIAKCAW